MGRGTGRAALRASSRHPAGPQRGLRRAHRHLAMDPAVTLVLAIDTATPAVTAGVVRRSADDVELLAERVTVDARAHAERLTPNVLDALASAGLTVAELDAVVVG